MTLCNDVAENRNYHIRDLVVNFGYFLMPELISGILGQPRGHAYELSYNFRH